MAQLAFGTRGVVGNALFLRVAMRRFIAGLLPIVSIVVPFWGYFLGSLIYISVKPKKGTRIETIGSATCALAVFVKPLCLVQPRLALIRVETICSFELLAPKSCGLLEIMTRVGTTGCQKRQLAKSM